MDLPTIDASDPNRVRHTSCPSTQTSGRSGPSSSRVMKRPAAGAVCSVSKKFQETSAPGTRAGSPPPVRMNSLSAK